MAADPDLTMSSPGGQLRALARRIGVAGFWSWWLGQLAALVPAAPRAALQRRRMRPVIAFDTVTASIWKPEARGGQLAMVEAATVPLEGDAAAVAAGGRAALASVQRTLNDTKVIVTLPPRTVLRKRLTLPAAVEEHLQQALGYDLDRHTPFKADELYFDAAVADRDPAHGTIAVDLAAARRNVVDAALRHAQTWGATVVAVSPQSPGATTASSLNLLPPELDVTASPWRRWQLWLPLGLTALLAITALALPLWQKREYAITLNRLVEEARGAALVSDNLRNELDGKVGDYNFALDRKYAYPSTVQVLDEVTRILPDDTWLTQLEIKTLRGKETQRELSLRGESINAGRLVTLLEDSHLVSQASPRSPTTKIQPGPGEIFDVGGMLRTLPPPASAPMIVADARAPAAPSSGAKPNAPAATQAPASAPAAASSQPGATAPQSAPAAATPAPQAASAAAAPKSSAPPAAADGASSATARGSTSTGGSTSPNAANPAHASTSMQPARADPAPATATTPANATATSGRALTDLGGNPPPVIVDAQSRGNQPVVRDASPIVRDAPPPNISRP